MRTCKLCDDRIHSCPSCALSPYEEWPIDTLGICEACFRKHKELQNLYNEMDDKKDALIESLEEEYKARSLALLETL